MSAAAQPARRLSRGARRPGPVYSAILTIPDPGVAAILGWSGLEYVVIDAEHGPFTLESMRSCVDALAASPAASVIRVAANDQSHIKQALDLGVDGVQVPSVGDADAAARRCAHRATRRRGRGASASATRRDTARTSRSICARRTRGWRCW